MLSSVVMKAISAAVSTVFVCFAEDHEALETSHPEEYKALSDAWYLLTHLLTDSLTHSPTHSLTHSLTYSLTLTQY